MKRIFFLLSSLWGSAALFATEVTTVTVENGLDKGLIGLGEGFDKGMIALSAGLAIGIAAIGGALGQGRAAAAAMEGTARNPESSKRLFILLILSLALIESLVIYALVVSFSLIGKL
ncbi:MAG TPA: hypothetical protein P5077_07385 [bacterium]|nr:hypothetical protein [bacterium]